MRMVNCNYNTLMIRIKSFGIIIDLKAKENEDLTDIRRGYVPTDDKG